MVPINAMVSGDFVEVTLKVAMDCEESCRESPAMPNIDEIGISTSTELVAQTQTRLRGQNQVVHEPCRRNHLKR